MTDPGEDHARWWQDEFTEGVDPEYTEQILPLVAAHFPESGRVLDVGCGEGQVARVASSRGLSTVGIDPAWSQVSVAATRGATVSYLQGSAAALPVRDASIDAAV